MEPELRENVIRRRICDPEILVSTSTMSSQDRSSGSTQKAGGAQTRTRSQVRSDERIAQSSAMRLALQTQTMGMEPSTSHQGNNSEEQVIASSPAPTSEMVVAPASMNANTAMQTIASSVITSDPNSIRLVLARVNELLTSTSTASSSAPTNESTFTPTIRNAPTTITWSSSSIASSISTTASMNGSFHQSAGTNIALLALNWSEPIPTTVKPPLTDTSQ